jgi:hypothetical protein
MASDVVTLDSGSVGHGRELAVEREMGKSMNSGPGA